MTEVTPKPKLLLSPGRQIAALIVLALVLAAALIGGIAWQQGAFSGREQIYFIADDVFGLAPGTTVRMSGFRIGKIQTMELQGDLTVRVTLSIDAEPHSHLRSDARAVVIREQLRVEGTQPIDVMWGHHPTFGSDLLDGPVEITSDGQCVSADVAYDPAANPLRPGAEGQWPIIDGKNGPHDLSRPHGPMAALTYLHDFKCGWIAMRRLDNAIAVVLSWDAKRFPCAWLWYELQGTSEAPWYGRASLIGLEPNTTMPANGLANAKARGGKLLRLQPGEELSTVLRLQVLQPLGAIISVNTEGRAR